MGEASGNKMPWESHEQASVAWTALLDSEVNSLIIV